MTDLARLMNEHGRMDQVACDLLACVAQPELDHERAITLRADLALLLDEHLTTEDPTLYAGAMSDQRDMCGELDSLCVEWADYLRDWNADGIVRDMPGFITRTTTMLTDIRDRIAIEQACLVALERTSSVQGTHA